MGFLLLCLLSALLAILSSCPQPWATRATPFPYDPVTTHHPFDSFDSSHTLSQTPHDSHSYQQQHDNPQHPIPTLARRQPPTAAVAIIPGPRVALGPARSAIVRASWIWSPGVPPARIDGNLYVYSGLYAPELRDQGDALQVVLESHDPHGMARACNATAGQWCMRAYAVHGCCLMQSMGEGGAAIEPLSRYVVAMAKDEGPGGVWRQKVWEEGNGTAAAAGGAAAGGNARGVGGVGGVDGLDGLDGLDVGRELVSLERGNAPVTWFGIASESSGVSPGITFAQTYRNITIVLEEADTEFGGTLFTSDKVQNTPPITSDGGKTWVVPFLIIPPTTREE